MSDQSPDLELERQQAALYGTYVANKPIDIGGARAFNKGDPVPATHVERGVVSEDDVDTFTPAQLELTEPEPKTADTSKTKAKTETATTTEPKGT